MERTKQTGKNDKDLHMQAEETASELRRVMAALVKERGFAPEAVIAGAHAEAAAAMVVAYGGLEAAERMYSAADQVARIHTPREAWLATISPAGSA